MCSHGRQGRSQLIKSITPRVEREAEPHVPLLHSPARPCPYLRAKAFGEILHAAQGGAQVNIVAVQEDAQQGMGGTGIGDQLESNTRTNLTSRNKAAFQQPLRADNNQLKALMQEPAVLVRAAT